MADPVYEGDTIQLFCSEAKGFVYAQSPSSSYSCVTVFPVSNPERPAQLKDPAFPNVHFASFQVLAENVNINLKRTSPLEVPRRNQDFLRRSLVYGRKVKLLHVASKMFLSSSEAEDENSIKTVTLVPEFNKETCLFRILPSRNKQRGEDVLPQDQIKLESVSDKGHHILCALNSLTSRYELKMAVTDSIFIISSQSSSHVKLPHKAMRGCDVVMLFNYKREGYLAGRGSIVMEVLPEEIKEDVVTEVGARKRESVHGIQKAPPLSGDCFWQLEKANAPLNGDQFKYGDHCRIKHLPTQQYLSVTQRGNRQKLTLKKLEAGVNIDPETTFSLVSVLGKNGGVNKGSYVEIRHVQSGKNLSVHTRASLQRLNSEPSIGPVSKSKWFELGLEDSDQSSQQYFRIEEVNSDIIHEYYHISGVTTVLKEYMQKFTADSSPLLDEPLEVLVKLCKWLRGEGNQKNRANMLRISQGIDILLGFLLVSKSLPHGKDLMKMRRKVSLVLQNFLESANKKSHLYLAETRFMNVLFSQIGCGIFVEEVLSTLVRDESSITSKVVKRLTQNPDFIERILQNLDASILNFLSTLCFTAGKPVQYLQNIIRKSIIVDGESQKVFIRTEIKDGVVWFVRPKKIAGPVSSICSKKKDLTGPEKKRFEFFIAQLKLFSRICKGVNVESIDLICNTMKLVSFEEALICINDPDLHPLLQSAYLDFVTSAYVESNVEESGVDVDNIWHSFYWNHICPNPMKAAGVGDTFAAITNKDEIKALQSSIRTYLSQSKILFAKEEVEGGNELLSQMLAVMEPLVSYGFYEKESDINEITRFLINLIDGMHDRPEPNAIASEVVIYQQKRRYKKNNNNQKIFSVKTRAVRILHQLFKMLVYATLGKLMFDFKYLRSNMEIGSDDDYTPANEGLASLLNEDYQLCEQDPQIIEVARARLRKLFQEPAYKSFDMKEGDGQGLVRILMDLLKYEDDELRLSSVLLLFDIFQEENILFNDATISYIVTQPSGKVYGYMVTDGSFSDDDKVFLKLLHGQAIEKPDDNTLHEKVVDVLKRIKTDCVIDDDETQPHLCNQGIAFSTGVFSAIMAYIQLFCSTDYTEQEPLLKLSCSCLQAIARRNTQVQKKIFDNFIDLIEAKIAVAPIARLMTETLCGNPLLCRHLSEANITHLYTSAATSDNPEHYEFFTTLQTVIKPYKSSEGPSLLLKNYQELVARTVSEHKQDHFSRMLLIDAQEERLTALKTTDDPTNWLLQLLAVSDLLASATEGLCKYPEDVCQAIFSLDELVTIISDPDIDLDRKKPFARILNEGYINTERDSLVSIAALSKNSSFWGHLEECALLMDLLHKKLSQDDFELENVKIEVRILFSQHSSYSARKERSKGFNETLEYNDKTILLSSLLCYLIDGVIPLVMSFCAQLAANTSTGLASQTYSSILTPPIVNVLKQISDSVVTLVQYHPGAFLTMPEMTYYWKMFTDIMVFMLPPDEIGQLNEMRENVLVNEDFFVSPALREVESELAEEMKLNANLQTFVENFKVTYEGYNHSAESNQGHFHQNDESSFVPAGTSFKELVKLFTDNIDDSSKLEKANSLLELMDVFYRQLQQPLTSKERTNIDFVLLTSLQILCGVVHTRIDSVNPELKKSDPNAFDEEYCDKIKPLQDALVDKKSHEKVIVHLAHPKDGIAIQVYAFLRALLYLGNENAQKKIGNMTSNRDTKFFIRLNQLLESVIASIGHPLSRQLRLQRNFSVTALPPPTDSVTQAIKGVEERETRHADKQTEGVRQGLPMDDLHVTAPSEGGEEETDFGGHFEPRNVRSYSIEGAGQLETSETDAKKRASVVLDVVSWICDGQNQQMQNILRKQESTFSSVNVVGAVATLFQTLAEHFNGKTIGSAKKAIQALIEVCAGNFTNQEVAFKGQIVDSINIILRCTTTSHSSLETAELMRVKASAVELLEVMIEETNENSKTLAQGIAQDLSVEDVMSTMKEFWDMKNMIDKDCGLDKTELERAMFRAYHVLKKIADYMGKSIDNYVNYDAEYGEHEDHEDMYDLWIHLRDSSRSIEVNYVTKNDEEILTKVYFPFAPNKELTETERAVVKDNIRRDSPEDKVKDLLEWMEAIRRNVRHKAKIKQKWYLQWAVAASGLRNFLLIILTLLLNLFVIVLFDVPERDNMTSNYTIVDDPVVASWFSDYLIFILGSFHIILSVWMVGEYFVREAPNILFRIPFFAQLLYDLRKWSDRYEYIRRWRSALNDVFCGGKLPSINKPVNSQCFEVYFISFPPLYRILFLIFSIVALGTHGYFYCGCILYVFLTDDVLQQVLTAIRRSAAQLISVALLGLGFLLIFAVVSFVFLHNFFDNDTMFCRTMIECYVSVIREGLLDTIGTMLPIKYTGQLEPSFTIYWARSIFDLLFFIIITTLGLNIVVAIIVDRFSELRSERDEIKNDKLNYCFVCGIDNDTFERKGKGFRDHVLNDHNMWNYVYFLLHLDSMHANDHNALEKYINDDIEGRKIGFFPLRKAKVLGGRVDDSAVQKS